MSLPGDSYFHVDVNQCSENISCIDVDIGKCTGEFSCIRVDIDECIGESSFIHEATDECIVDIYCIHGGPVPKCQGHGDRETNKFLISVPCD